jgi:hypothetical protein
MPIIQKRSLTSGSIPTTASLAVGEIAMNIPDGRIYLRKSGSGSDTIQSAITTGAQNSGSIFLTGSLSISGTGSVFDVAGDVLEFSGDQMEFTGSFITTGSLRVIGDTTITGSLRVSGSITGSLLGTASFSTSSSFANTASFATSASWSTSQFPYTGSAIVSGSLIVTGSVNITGSLLLNGSPVVTGQIILTAGGGWPSVTSGSNIPVITETTTNRVNFYYIGFPDTIQTFANWSMPMPSDYNGGTITAVFYWVAGNASTNSVRWGLQARAFADGNLIDQAFGTAQEVTDANQANDSVNISAATPAITIGGTPAASNFVQFRAYRNPGDAADTLAATAELLSIRITYTRA